MKLSKPVFFLMGPTASGKTALAIELVQEFPFEIISVDSALIYRDMNIGTAKPTPAELEHAPHHLIDIIDPDAHYSAGQFVKDANELIAAIHARGKIPLLMGGTMLYFKALQQGISAMPEQDPQIRAQIEAEALAQGWPALHVKLAKVDPVSAAKIKATDSQRIQRALEVFYLTGKPLSAFHLDSRLRGNDDYISLALFPQDRSILHERIALRVDAMLQKGFIDEVQHLRQKYGLTGSLPSMRAVGYRQVWQYLEGEIPLGALHDKILFATRQYAKRQLTWLKSWENLYPFDLSETARLKRHLSSILSSPFPGCFV